MTSQPDTSKREQELAGVRELAGVLAAANEQRVRAQLDLACAMRRARLEGATLEQIASAAGTSRQRVHTVLRGITTTTT